MRVGFLSVENPVVNSPVFCIYGSGRESRIKGSAQKVGLDNAPPFARVSPKANRLKSLARENEVPARQCCRRIFSPVNVASRAIFDLPHPSRWVSF